MLKLASDPKNVARVESFVEHLVDKYGISPDVYGNILISLTEAVTNAIIHGNDKDESKTVQVRLKKQKNKLAFLISDVNSIVKPINLNQSCHSFIVRHIVIKLL